MMLMRYTSINSSSSNVGTSYAKYFAILSICLFNCFPVIVRASVVYEPCPVDIDAEFLQLVDVLLPVWDSISDRDESALFEYLDHDDIHIQDAAWRGLANMPVVNVERLLAKAISGSSSLRWFGLSTQTFNSGQLRQIEEFASRDGIADADLAGIYLVLGLKGDTLSHDFLLNRLGSTIPDGVNYALGLAISRSSLRIPLNKDQQLAILKQSIQAKDVRNQSAWLYGWYRNATVKLDVTTVSSIAQWARAYHDEAYGLLRQYWMNILSKHQHPAVIELLTNDYLADIHVLEGVEAVRALNRYDYGPEIERLQLALLSSDHIYMRMEVLQVFSRLEAVPTDLVREILLDNLKQAASNPYEWMWTIRALAHHWKDEARKALEEYPRDWTDNPHFVNDYIEMLKSVYISDDVIDQMMSLALSKDEAILVPLVSQASQLLMGDAGNNEKRAIIATLLHRIALQEGHRLSAALATSDQALDWRGDQLNERLLAHIEAGINQRLNYPQNLQKPDGELLKRLGRHPIWILETEAGEIHMRMDVLRNPSTVTGFSSVVENSWYDGTPFHRVVHNFVIQGGALWNDTFLGEDAFRLPTEATELEFSRGAVGVASSGRDTEGTQFFMMHMWHPHLNGGYSNIGMVVAGQEVVDRLTQGTLVLRSSLNACN
jgi:cyclophilin family peptidyl-prolyl cis-trans isomerase